MKKISSVIFLAAILPFFLGSCDDNEEVNPDMLFKNGVLVINEGNFQSPNGSVDFYDLEKDSLIRGVIKQQNEGVGIGASIMSAYRNGDLIYFITNSPDKIEVVSADRLIYQIDPIAGEDISQPRQMTVAGNKGYVSCWGSWEEDYQLPHSYVAVINLDDHSVEKKIDVHDGAEGILAYNSKVFVAGSYSRWITVIDAPTGEAIDSVQTPYAPTSLVMDENDKMWVICTGPWGEDGALLRINPENHEIEENIAITGDSPSGKLTIGEGNTLYYLTYPPYPETGSSIYQMDISATGVPEEAFISGGNFYGIAIEPNGQMIYIGDAKDYQSNGVVYRYQSDGALLDSLSVGISPNGFIFL